MRALLLLLCLYAPLSLAQLPAQTTNASYAAYWNGSKIGTGTQRFRIDDAGNYQLWSESSAAGVLDWISKDRVSESSAGRIDGSDILPTEYHYHHRNRFGTKREGRVEFDWAQSKVTNHVEDSHWQMPIPSGTQDKASMQLALLQGLQDGKRDMLFQVADGGRLKQYRFYATGEEERLATKIGDFDTIKLAREKNGRKPQVFLWVAPSLGYLPVRILREKRGREIILDIVSLDQ